MLAFNFNNAAVYWHEDCIGPSYSSMMANQDNMKPLSDSAWLKSLL